MKALLSVVVLALSVNAFAGTDLCVVNFNQKGSAVNWTAFKTPKKVGVKASFTDFTISTKKSVTVEELLSSASFEINSKKIESGDKARDLKIFNFFFKTMVKGTKITGKVVKVNADKVDVELTLNGTTKTVVMTSKYDEKKGLLTLNGAVDVLEFGMKDNLAAITKACYEKHEGVTWPDVQIELVASVTKSCK
ncbi:MAG: YceI family protein [Bacteriovoracaceae bacterium]|jgi:polyisoprenoid-binding protein YceI